MPSTRPDGTMAACAAPSCRANRRVRRALRADVSPLPSARFSPEALIALGELWSPRPRTRRRPRRDRDEENPGIAPATPISAVHRSDLTLRSGELAAEAERPRRAHRLRTRASISTTSTARPTISLSYESDGRTLQLGRPLTATARQERARPARHVSRPAVPRRAPGPHRRSRNDETSSSRSCRRPCCASTTTSPTRIRETSTRSSASWRWHYQWVVLHDFLPTIVESRRFARVLRI